MALSLRIKLHFMPNSPILKVGGRWSHCRYTDGQAGNQTRSGGTDHSKSLREDPMCRSALVVRSASVLIMASLQDGAIVAIYVCRCKTLGCTAFADKTHCAWHFNCAKSIGLTKNRSHRISDRSFHSIWEICGVILTFTASPQLVSSEQPLSKMQEWTESGIQYEYFRCNWWLPHTWNYFEIATYFIICFLFLLFKPNASDLPSGFSELTRYYTNTSAQSWAHHSRYDGIWTLALAGTG